MDVRYSALPEAQRQIVYVRPVPVADLPQEVQDQIGPLEVIWSVHNVAGERLALVADKQLAFALARQHDFTPVSVH